MANKPPVSNTTESTEASSQKESKVTYVFLASRLFPFNKEGSITTDKNGNLTANEETLLLSLDVTTRFRNRWEGDLSKYPVSAGSEITDNMSIKNKKFTLVGVISDTPFERRPGEFFGKYGTGYPRASRAVEALDVMFRNKLLFTLYSEYEKIDNCIITSVDFEQRSEDAVVFSIEIEQLRFAYAKSVMLNVKKSVNKTTASNKNGGGSTKQSADQSAKSLSDHRRQVKEAIETNKRANE